VLHSGVVTTVVVVSITSPVGSFFIIVLGITVSITFNILIGVMILFKISFGNSDSGILMNKSLFSINFSQFSNNSFSFIKSFSNS
jgi:hypothetical protein